VTRALAALLLCALGACTRQERPRGAQRVAILALENLSGDPSLDWVGPAAAAIAAAQAHGSPGLHPLWAATRQEALRARPTRIVSGYFSASRDGALRVRAVDEDLLAARMRPFALEARPADPAALASALARQVALATRPSGPKNAEAAREYGSALAASTEQRRRDALERSLAADPAFGDARVALVELSLARGDRAGAERLIGETPAETGELARARLALARATLAGDGEALLEALARISDLTPADSDAARRLADTLTSRRRFDQAIGAYRRAVAADPGNGLAWNQLAYAQAFAGDLAAARESLAAYERLEPEAANPQDSLGEALYHHGRFEEAEAAFLETFRRNPGFLNGAGLAKAAQSALMRGDPARAAGHMKRFLELRAQSDADAAERIAAQWDHLTGRRREARERLERLASRLDFAGDWAQLAVWALVEGDRPLARGYAQRSVKRGPQVISALAIFLTEPPASAAEWKARAERTFPGAGLANLRRQALAYALFAAGRYAEAVPLLREIFDATPPAGDGLIRSMLGAALRQTGAKEESARLLARHGLPPPGGWDVFMPLAPPQAPAAKPAG
jgi:tetratricopeptide (TPR) repeat protein